MVVTSLPRKARLQSKRKRSPRKRRPREERMMNSLETPMTFLVTSRPPPERAQRQRRRKRRQQLPREKGAEQQAGLQRQQTVRVFYGYMNVVANVNTAIFFQIYLLACVKNTVEPLYIILRTPFGQHASVLIKEMSLFQRSLIERFHCSSVVVLSMLSCTWDILGDRQVPCRIPSKLQSPNCFQITQNQYHRRWLLYSNF